MGTTRRILSAAAAAGVLSVATAVPASAVPDLGSPGWNRSAGQAVPADRAPEPVVREVFVDDDSLEHLQIGLGVLAGMAAAGAAAVTVRRRGHTLRTRREREASLCRLGGPGT